MICLPISTGCWQWCDAQLKQCKHSAQSDILIQKHKPITPNQYRAIPDIVEYTTMTVAAILCGVNHVWCDLSCVFVRWSAADWCGFSSAWPGLQVCYDFTTASVSTWHPGFYINIILKSLISFTSNLLSCILLCICLSVFVVFVSVWQCSHISRVLCSARWGAQYFGLLYLRSRVQHPYLTADTLLTLPARYQTLLPWNVYFYELI